ncbi:hypothetical protein GEV33_014978 [Tenebrio molitor]|uniref:Uncharacterized protein n=1 Tax=Tenebrio molitor TaxID=7067 RepID=A0A8J6H5S8_TENMO|nr:hypothetical protein GEV33_014978 [Tenebrio molitor]
MGDRCGLCGGRNGNARESRPFSGWNATIGLLRLFANDNLAVATLLHLRRLIYPTMIVVAVDHIRPS